MIKLLREYIEDDKRIMEYTRDGETVSHKIIEDINSGSNEDEEIVIPKSPIEELKEENEKLKQADSLNKMIIVQLDGKMLELEAKINELKEATKNELTKED